MAINPTAATFASTAVRQTAPSPVLRAEYHAGSDLPFDMPRQAPGSVLTSPLAGMTIISQSSTTSLDGTVTTVTLYADGRTDTTVTGGDIVDFSFVV